jgi:hypothetical protein
MNRPVTSTIFFTIVAILIFFVGYKIGVNSSPSEKEYINQFLEIEHLRNDTEILTNLEVLTLLEKKKVQLSIDVLRMSTASLIEKPIRVESKATKGELNRIYREPSDYALQDALDYQKTFCIDSCLGL